MSEKPIIFSAPMIRAILDGRKTQTRRLLGKRVQPAAGILETGYDVADISPTRIGSAPTLAYDDNPWEVVPSPYGVPGDELWVRESFWQAHRYPGAMPSGEAEPISRCRGRLVHYAADGEPPNTRNRHYPKGLRNGAIAAPEPFSAWEKRPSIHMPRWASRIQLVVKDVRVERVQEISGQDCIAEGAADGTDLNMRLQRTDAAPFHEQRLRLARKDFAALWDSINGRKAGCSWQDNPWTWVVTFEVKGEARRTDGKA